MLCLACVCGVRRLVAGGVEMEFLELRPCVRAGWSIADRLPATGYATRQFQQIKTPGRRTAVRDRSPGHDRSRTRGACCLAPPGRWVGPGGVCWWAVGCLPGGSGKVGGDDVGGVPVEAAAGTTWSASSCADRRARRLPAHPEAAPGHRGGSDERMPQRVRPDRLGDPGAAGYPAHDPRDTVPVQPLPIKCEEDWPLAALADRQVARAVRGASGMVTTLLLQHGRPPHRNGSYAAAGARPGTNTGRRPAVSRACADLAGIGGRIDSGGSVRPTSAKLPRNFPLVAWDGASSHDSVESQFFARSATVSGQKGAP